ncbi:MAG: cytochrome c5 family protein [Thiomargarita sp.]|nr:cytochrome c5 family protein [Thiomargarita sp.]
MLKINEITALCVLGCLLMTGCSQETSSPEIDSSIVKGKLIYHTTCMGCHTTGLLKAPKVGDKNAWAPRIKKGVSVLVDNSINGFNIMPAMGGNLNLSHDDMKNAVIYMISESQ